MFEKLISALKNPQNYSKIGAVILGSAAAVGVAVLMTLKENTSDEVAEMMDSEVETGIVM